MRGRGKRKRPSDDGWAERGGYMNAKMQKLEEQNLANNLVSHIFKGVSIYVNGYTKPTSEELKVMVTQNGGVYTHYYSKTRVTHIVASNLPTSKVNHLRDEKVVKPQWITESLQAGKLLPYQPYLLYNPQNLQQNNVITSFVTSHAQKDFKIGSDFISNKSSIDNQPEDISNKTDNQNFVSEFYNRSRLHHISMWGAESKAYVANLQKQRFEDKSGQSFEGMERLMKEVQTSSNPDTRILQSGQKVYAHIDIDCFFVSVGLLKRPELKGQPIAVTHSKGKDPQSSLGNPGEVGGLNSRSDIASCSYEARKMGVSNGMHFGDAKKICPNLVAIPYDFEDYKRISRIFYDIVLSYTLEVEAVSCDELYLDCTDLLRRTGASPLQLASSLRREILRATGCNSSCGMGSNMLIARLSTKRAKPNGQLYVERGEEIDFMRGFEVSDLPGIGRVMTKKLKSMGVHSCEELCKVSLSELQRTFGVKVGARLYGQARGEDERTLSVDVERKSVSAEINYGIRFTRKKEADDFIRELSKEVQNRLQQLNKKGKHLTLKIKVRQEGAPVETYKFLGHGICDNISKSHMLPLVTDDAEIIGTECCNMLALLNIPIEDLRGIGIQMASLEGLLDHRAPQKSANSILKYATFKSSIPDQLPPPVLSRSDDDDRPSVSNNMDGGQAETTIDNEYVLSLSQVDMDTLKELPEDIQKEIEDYLKTKNERKDAENGQPGGDARPGCSHWGQPQEVERIADPGENQPPGQSESMEALDESFLRAMPEDIRLELLNAQKQQKQQQQHQRMALKTGPPNKKLQPPLLKNHKKNATKSKRGRPIKGSDKTKSTKTKPQSMLNFFQKNQQVPKLLSDPKPPVANQEAKVNNNNNNNNNNNKRPENNIQDRQEEEQEVNFQGAVEVSDIKQLIRNLIERQTEPDVNNVESLLEFLLRLVQAADLERAFILLRFLQRKEDVNLLWKKEIKNMIAMVQAAVASIYGGKFKMLAI